MENYMKTAKEINEILKANNMVLVERRGVLNLRDTKTKITVELKSLFRAIALEEENE